jgi:tRNA 5-methylaminomethyl-2-thiouridine biosynthesis bifunctional protein
MPRLPPDPRTHVDDTGMIYGDDFQDTYFSRDNGLAETQLVFLEGCGLPSAWTQKSCFVIGELGFGTGLNVLATWALWNKTRPKGGVLHIITVEGFLLESHQAHAAHKKWPELKHLSDQLIAKWPTRSYGAQRVWFPIDGICITFLIGPCEDMLKRMQFAADCWFLDGFAPSRNPDMWSTGVFSQIARLCAPHARLATYSVAGVVKSGLREAGFEVARLAGFGSKRQRLQARLSGLAPQQVQRPKTAIIIGGGIAGASVAAALTRRGITIDLFDDDPSSAVKASGNPIALVMPRLDRGDTVEARFFRSAYLMALEAYGGMGAAFQRTGVHEVRAPDTEALRLIDLGQDPPLPISHLSPSARGGLDHKQGGLVCPDLALTYLKQGATIHPVRVAHLQTEGGIWRAIDASGHCLATADICIIANGPRSAELSDLGSYLRGRLGQISWAPLTDNTPVTPISGGAYGAPFQNRLVFGATFDPCDLMGPVPAVSATSHARNQNMLAQIAPDLAQHLQINKAAGRVAIRATTPDQMPIAGRLNGGEEGKFIVCGLGSRGFTSAFLCAEIIASQACNEPSPVEAAVANALAPDRFAKRAAKRAPTRDKTELATSQSYRDRS